ncbi:dethiobiotin synthase [Alcanivorax sp. JB21]|uniref:dethiobiotin synthase n=1 Tax=Alcanivorax limicola TaxID=2874102 RepID=UPI001CBF895D|nr:dethiobiotin synthase [Alcanivorax limicola]MBZ2189320.1 dethiobiotin synthase [Alcanivorax limicola]
MTDRPVPRGRFFITGTDTGVGKTWVASRLLERASAAGLRTLGLKPVAAGADDMPSPCGTHTGPTNEDARELMQAASIKLPYDQINPVLLQAPMAPHLAAEQEGKRLSVARLAGYVRGALLSEQAREPDLLLVEGAGGWLVPLNDRETLADLAKELELPVILVVGMRLGCLNHALLSAEVIRASGLRLAGWVANRLPGEPMPAVEENEATLTQWLRAPRIRA